MYSCGPLLVDEQRQDDQLEPTYSSSVPIRDVAQKTYRKQWMIGRSGERGSVISVLIAGHDDDIDVVLLEHLLVKLKLRVDFRLYHTQPNTHMHICLPNPSTCARYDIRLYFKRNLTVLNSECSFSETGCLTKVKEPACSTIYTFLKM